MQKCFYRHRQKIYSNIRGRKLAEKYTTFSFKTSTKMGEKSQVRKIAQQIKKMEQHFNETSERRNCEKRPLTKSGKVRKKHKPQRKVRKNGKSGRVAAASLPSLLSSLDPFSLPELSSSSPFKSQFSTSSSSSLASTSSSPLSPLSLSPSQIHFH